MGKCIVHCAECGKAIREDDFSQRKAVAIENRTFCSGCREVAPETRRTRKDSTRMRVPLPVAVARKSTLPLFAGGLILGFGLVVLIGIAIFRPETGRMTRVDVPPAEQPTAIAATPVIRKAVPEVPPRIEFRTPAAPAPADASPSIRLTSPLKGARFQSPADIAIEAEVGRRNGPVRVEFYHGPIKLGETDAAPYRWVWKGLRYPGTYELMAKWVGAQGESIESQTVWVSVDREQPAVATHVLATVSPSAPDLAPQKPELVEPRDGSSFTAPASITLSATSEDADRMEFFEGKNRLGEAGRRPFSFVWTKAPAGIYEIRARAVRGDGETAVSEVVSIVVRPPATGAKLEPLPPRFDQRRVDEAIRR